MTCLVRITAGTLALTVAAALAGAPCRAAEPAGAASPQGDALDAAHCLDPRLAVDFHRLDATRVAVDTTRGAFLLTLADQCLNLAARSHFQFRSARADQRICGLLGEYIVLADGDSCRIGRVEPMSRERYRALGAPRHDAETTTPGS